MSANVLFCRSSVKLSIVNSIAVRLWMKDRNFRAKKEEMLNKKTLLLLDRKSNPRLQPEKPQLLKF